MARRHPPARRVRQGGRWSHGLSFPRVVYAFKHWPRLLSRLFGRPARDKNTHEAVSLSFSLAFCFAATKICCDRPKSLPAETTGRGVEAMDFELPKSARGCCSSRRAIRRDPPLAGKAVGAFRRRRLARARRLRRLRPCRGQGPGRRGDCGGIRRARAGRGDRGLLFAAGAHVFGCLAPVAHFGSPLQVEALTPGLRRARPSARWRRPRRAAAPPSSGSRPAPRRRRVAMSSAARRPCEPMLRSPACFWSSPDNFPNAPRWA